jgi:hypothetical protein
MTGVPSLSLSPSRNFAFHKRRIEQTSAFRRWAVAAAFFVVTAFRQRHGPRVRSGESCREILAALPTPPIDRPWLTL